MPEQKPKRAPLIKPTNAALASRAPWDEPYEEYGEASPSMPKLVLGVIDDIRAMLRAPIRSDLYAMNFVEQIASAYVLQSETKPRDAVYAGEVQAASERLHTNYTTLLSEMRRDPKKVLAIEEVLMSAFYIGLVCDRDGLHLHEALSVAQKVRAKKGASSNKLKADARHKRIDDVVHKAALASQSRGFTTKISGTKECVGRLLRDREFVDAIEQAKLAKSLKP